MIEALRALVVDHDNQTAAFHAALLENAGFLVNTANLASDVLLLIPSFDPDLVLIGWPLHGMEGGELVARIRECTGGAWVGLLFLSADRNKDAVAQTIDMDAASVLVKPVDQILFPVQCRAIASSSRKTRESQSRLKAIEAEQKFQELVLNNHAIASMADMSGNITYVNDKFCEISGYGKEELIGKKHSILKSGQHPPEFYSEMWKTIASGKTWQGVICNRRKDGSFYWVESTITPYMGPDGKPCKYMSIRTDVTHLKDLVDQVSLQANVLSVTMDGILIVDARQPDFPIVYANPAFSSMTGFRLKEILGKNCRFLNAGDKDQKGIRMMRSAISNCEETRVVVRNYRKDGSMFWNEVHLSPVFNAERVLTHYVAIEQDVTMRIESEMALRKAKEEADRANQAKSTFLSSMSHELRTPMNAILGFGQLMESDPGLSAMNRDNVKEILKAGHHLLVLINDVLDLARIESGKMYLSLEPVELLPLVEECIALVSLSAAERNILIDHEGFSDVAVRADRVRLKQALLNLVSNALKYNKNGGIIRLMASASESSLVRMTVVDSGQGISPERMAELFQPFSRLGAELSDIEGTGIGLNITKRLVEMMGGKVGVQSEMGVGSRFWIDLPRALLNQHSMQLELLPMEKLEQHGIATERTLLYIEDNPANVKLMEQAIGHIGNVRLLAAHTAELGIKIAEAHRPDMIMLDIHFPGMDGYQMLEIMKSKAWLKNIPVVAITANTMPGDIERGRAAGFDEYLTKPIDIEKMLDVVVRLLPPDDGEKA